MQNTQDYTIICNDGNSCDDNIYIATKNVISLTLICEKGCNNVEIYSSAGMTEMRCKGEYSCNNIDFYCGEYIPYQNGNNFNINDFNGNATCNINCTYIGIGFYETAYTCVNTNLYCKGDNIQECNVNVDVPNGFYTSPAIVNSSLYCNTHSNCSINCDDTPNYDANYCDNINVYCSDYMDINNTCNCFNDGLLYNTNADVCNVTSLPILPTTTSNIITTTNNIISTTGSINTTSNSSISTTTGMINITTTYYNISDLNITSDIAGSSPNLKVVRAWIIVIGILVLLGLVLAVFSVCKQVKESRQLKIANKSDYSYVPLKDPKISNDFDYHERKTIDGDIRTKGDDKLMSTRLQDSFVDGLIETKSNEIATPGPDTDDGYPATTVNPLCDSGNNSDNDSLYYTTDTDVETKFGENEDDILGINKSININNSIRINEWYTWNSDQIVDWIVSLENFRFKKYEKQLRIKFRKDMITGQNIKNVNLLEYDDITSDGNEWKIDAFDMFQYIKKHLPESEGI